MHPTVTASICLAIFGVLATHGSGQERDGQARDGNTLDGRALAVDSISDRDPMRRIAAIDAAPSILDDTLLSNIATPIHSGVDDYPSKLLLADNRRAPVDDGLVELGPVPPSAVPSGSVQPAAAWSEQRNFQIVPYGSFWANMLYATERTNPGPFTLFVPSAGVQGEDAFTIDARRSRFGLNVTGPDVPVVGGLSSGGRVEVDFLGEFVNENQAQARIRHVYLELQNEQHRFLVGQTWDVISPLNPRTLNFSVGWLGGNIGFRRAQFRYERHGELSESTAWSLASSLNQEITPDFPTDPGIVRESGNYPVVELRLGVTRELADRERPLELGVSAHIGETGFDFLRPGPPPLLLPPLDDARFETWSYNVDIAIPVTERLHLQGEFFQGKNLSPFLGGIGQGVCPCTRSAIGSLGGWADAQYTWNDWLTTAVGYGVDDPRDDDFLLGRTSNQFLFTNALLHLTDALTTGVECTFWRTLYQDQRAGQVAPSELIETEPGESVTIDWMVRYDF